MTNHGNLKTGTALGAAGAVGRRTRRQCDRIRFASPGIVSPSLLRIAPRTTPYRPVQDKRRAPQPLPAPEGPLFHFGLHGGACGRYRDDRSIRRLHCRCNGLVEFRRGDLFEDGAKLERGLFTEVRSKRRWAAARAERLWRQQPSRPVSALWHGCDDRVRTLELHEAALLEWAQKVPQRRAIHDQKPCEILDRSSDRRGSAAPGSRIGSRPTRWARGLRHKVLSRAAPLGEARRNCRFRARHRTLVRLIILQSLIGKHRPIPRCGQYLHSQLPVHGF